MKEIILCKLTELRGDSVTGNDTTPFPQPASRIEPSWNISRCKK